MKFIKRSAVAGVAIIAAVGLAGCGSTLAVPVEETPPRGR